MTKIYRDPEMTVDDIKEVFKVIGHKYLEDWKGNFIGHAEVVCEIGGKYYLVDLLSEVVYEPPNTYYFADFPSVTYKECEKTEEVSLLEEKCRKFEARLLEIKSVLTPKDFANNPKARLLTEIISDLKEFE